MLQKHHSSKYLNWTPLGRRRWELLVCVYATRQVGTVCVCVTCQVVGVCVCMLHAKLVECVCVDVTCQVVGMCVCMLDTKLWESVRMCLCVCYMPSCGSVCVDVSVCNMPSFGSVYGCLCMLHAKFILSSYCGSVCGCLCYMPSSFCHPTVGVCVGVYVTCQVHFVILLWECVWMFMLRAKFILSSYCGSVVRICLCICYMPSSFWKETCISHGDNSHFDSPVYRVNSFVCFIAYYSVIIGL